MGAGLARGGVTSTFGAPGDIETFIRELRGNKDPSVLPTTERVSNYLPSTGTDTKTFEKLGEFANPVTPAKKVIAASHIAAPALAAAKAGLYANALRPGLLMGHSTKASGLLPPETGGLSLPKELYNLSLGITEDAPMHFHGGDTFMVARQGAFDPKTTPTSLHAFDAYTPRFPHAEGKRADELTRILRNKKSAEFLEPEMLKIPEIAELTKAYGDAATQAAKARMLDKFFSRYPKGGTFQEGAGPLMEAKELPQYGKGGFGGDVDPNTGKFKGYFDNPDPVDTLQMLSYGKRFPTFESYEIDPTGAARLGNKTRAPEVYSDVFNFIKKNRAKIKTKTGIEFPGWFDETQMEEADEPARILKMLAAQNPRTSNYDKDLAQHAQQLIKNLRRTKSSYGEAKSWGSVGIHPENFAGMIANESLDPDTLKMLEAASKKRGLQFDTAYFDPKNVAANKLMFNKAKEMQGESYRAQLNPADFPKRPRTPPIDFAKLKAKLNKPATTPKDLSDEELDWMMENDPGNPFFD
jgi:hypothetical protein